jgi:hypothetical protein
MSKLDRTSITMAYHPKGRIDKPDTSTIQEQLNRPQFHYFEDCRDKIRPEAAALDNPPPCRLNYALSYKEVMIALRGGGPLMTSFLVYRYTQRATYIRERRQGIASCARRLDNKPTLDALTTESQESTF